MLSIIIPTYNEMQHGYLHVILPSLDNIPNTEVICVDSGSRDGTQEFIRQAGFPLYMTDGMTRAHRMNVGVEKATGDTLLLYHPRILIDKAGIDVLVENAPKSWGGFKHRFTLPRKLYKFISWYSNNIRVLKKNLVYLDHGIFMSRELACKAFPIPEEPIFEDTLLSRLLAKDGPATLINHTAHVSPIRFEENGPFKQFLTNQMMKLLFGLGIDLNKLNNWYERGMRLNG